MSDFMRCKGCNATIVRFFQAMYECGIVDDYRTMHLKKSERPKKQGMTAWTTKIKRKNEKTK